MAREPVQKPGAYGTLYRYAVEYRDPYDPGFPPGAVWRCWAYSEEHALEKFLDSDEGFEAVSVRTVIDRK